MLELVSCQRLINDVLSILKKIPIAAESSKASIFEAVITAMMQVLRYTEFINQKPIDLPQLLLPAINDLRASMQGKLLPESYFFNIDCNRRRKNRSLAFILSEEGAMKARHLRQMYQFGLIEVLHRTNITGGLKVMKNVVRQLDKDCARPNSPNFWWISEALLDCFRCGGVMLTMNRMRLFSRIDRQIKNLSMIPKESRLELNKEINLLSNQLLYLSSISDKKTELTTQVLNHFNLNEDNLTDKTLRLEASIFSGPSKQDYSSLAEALINEIKDIESIILSYVGNGYHHADIVKVKNKIVDLRSLLKLLMMDEYELKLSILIDYLSGLVDNKKQLTKNESRTIVNVISNIRKRISGAGCRDQVEDSKFKLKQINPAQDQICVRAHLLIKKLINTFSKFVDNNRRVLLIKNVPGMLNTLQQDFGLLEVKEAHLIFEGCFKFVNMYLIKAPSQMSEKSVNLFVDIIASLEFYLETRKYTSFPSPRILRFAQSSLSELNELMDSKKRVF